MADTFRVTQIVFKKCVVRYQTYYIRMLARVELHEYVSKKEKKKTLQNNQTLFNPTELNADERGWML